MIMSDRGTSPIGSAEITLRSLFDRRSAAIRAKNLDQLLSFYSADVVYFDIVPPLQYVGLAALRSRFSRWFASYEGPIEQEIHDLSLVAAEDVATAWMLIGTGGILASGAAVGFSVRATTCCRRAAGGPWLIAHEHVSLPVDLATRTAAVDEQRGSALT
jgi:ketosteroid isomerase-like protein